MKPFMSAGIAALSIPMTNTMTSTPPRPKSLNGGRSPTGLANSSKPAVKSFSIAGASPTGAVRPPASASHWIMLSLPSPMKCKSLTVSLTPGHPNPSLNPPQFPFPTPSPVPPVTVPTQYERSDSS
nr:MAG TPA: hypothetical protein [Caudoviricetes sp.]